MFSTVRRSRVRHTVFIRNFRAFQNPNVSQHTPPAATFALFATYCFSSAMFQLCSKQYLPYIHVSRRRFLCFSSRCFSCLKAGLFRYITEIGRSQQKQLSVKVLTLLVASRCSRLRFPKHRQFSTQKLTKQKSPRDSSLAALAAQRLELSSSFYMNNFLTRW